MKSDAQQLEMPTVAPRSPSGVDRKLFYVTNGNNLRGILSSGLIRPRTGWPKYAADFQELFSGHVPLFCDGVPFEMMESVTTYDRHDFPAILEIDAQGWGGAELLAVNKDGNVTKVSFDSLCGSACAILSKGVVPLADVTKVHFGQAEDAKRFASDCRAMANTRSDLTPVGHTFKGISDIDMALPSSEAVSPSGSDQYGIAAMRRIDAVGGVLSALLRMQSKGSHRLLRDVFLEWTPEWQDDEDTTSGLGRELRLAVTAWIEGNKPAGADPNAIILRLALDSLSSQPFVRGLSPEAFLDSLDTSAATELKEFHEVLRTRLATIRSSVLHDEDPAQLFQATGSCVMRGILLMLLDNAYREDRRLPIGCTPSAPDLLMAEVLRGALHGWTRVPITMRGAPKAELAVGYAMARLSGGGAGSFKFPVRSFEWVDEEALFSRLLADILKGISDVQSRKRVQRYAAEQGAADMEIKINVKTKGKVKNPGIVRTVTDRKRGKKISLVLNLPQN